MGCTRLSNQHRHVPKPETAFITVAPDLVSVIWFAKSGHIGLFLFRIILDCVSYVAIAAKSNFEVYSAWFFMSKTIKLSIPAKSVKGPASR